MKRETRKTFQSEDIKRINRMKRMTWLIPAAISIWYVFLSLSWIQEQLRTEFSVAAIVSVIILYLIFLPLFSAIPFSIARAYVRRAKQELLKNNTFRSIDDFDYYRDKLEGVSPGVISLLTDLKIEPQKDMAAYLLKFEEMGIVRSEGGQYVTTEKYATTQQLQPSERYLIDHLLHNNVGIGQDITWQRMVEQEAIRDGYIVSRGSSKKRPAFGCLIPLLLFITASKVFISMSDRYDEMFNVLEHAGTNDMLLVDQMRLLLDHPQFILLIFLLLALVALLFRGLFFPLIALAGAMGVAKNASKFKRTPKGEETAGYIYGLKNFIRDFSNLNQADKAHLALWDDYLVYAVVLEENQQIVQEVIALRTARRRV